VSSPGSGEWTLHLEMEGHEHTNRVRVNGQTIGYLPRQTWADTWMSAALPVPAGVLRVGYNELTIEVGQAIPDCRSPGYAWDELLFRRVRLERAEPTGAPGSSLTAVLPSGGVPVTITIVFDNNTNRPGLETAWGFACVMQHGEHTLLFDTGGDGRMLLANMAALGFEPSDLDTIVLSHHHADHTGGLESVLKQNADVTVYLPQAFRTSFKDRARSLGAHVVEVTGPVEIAPGVWSTGQTGDNIVEQGLIVQTVSGLTVITGCAHPGIVEMVRRAQEVGKGGEVDLVMGGLHLSGASAATIQSVIQGLRILGVERVAPCHCTGEEAVHRFAATYGEDYIRCGVGLVLQEGKGDNR
jgi:7,8-dihydropterin-6-yl-methyl-4-(beta-D-ribofuranosyl)aminobenzene 5'-phosphate synthase